MGIKNYQSSINSSYYFAFSFVLMIVPILKSHLYSFKKPAKITKNQKKKASKHMRFAKAPDKRVICEKPKSNTIEIHIGVQSHFCTLADATKCDGDQILPKYIHF